MARAFGVEILADLGPAGPAAPRFNVAPGQPTWVITDDGKARRAVWGMTRWGPRPAVNVRSERLRLGAASPGYADAPGRGIIVVDGFYEWSGRRARRRRPHFVAHADGSSLLLPIVWRPPAPGALPTFAIVTVPAAGVVAPLHDRMPPQLSRVRARAWLSGAPAAEAFAPDDDAGALVEHPVDRYVDDPRNEGPRCVAPSNFNDADARRGPEDRVPLDRPEGRRTRER